MTRPYELYYSPPITIEIKYGMKMSSKNSKSAYPTMLDHFRVTTRERHGDNLKVHEEIMSQLGEHPKSIRIRLLSDDPDEDFALFRSWYNKGDLLCGSVYSEKTAKRFVSVDKKVTKLDKPNEAYPCSEECDQWKKELCALSGNLYFRLDPCYGVDSNALGILRVKSINALRRITASLNILKQETGGILANIPLQLQIHQELKADKSGTYRKIPMISVAPGLDMISFNTEVKNEVIRRSEMYELINGEKHKSFEDIKVKNVLSEVQQRSSIFADIEDGTIDEHDLEDIPLESTEDAEEMEPDPLTPPDDVVDLIRQLKMTKNMVNSYVARFVNSDTNKVDWVGFKKTLVDKLENQ